MFSLKRKIGEMPILTRSGNREQASMVLPHTAYAGSEMTSTSLL